PRERGNAQLETGRSRPIAHTALPPCRLRRPYLDRRPHGPESLRTPGPSIPAFDARWSYPARNWFPWIPNRQAGGCPCVVGILGGTELAHRGRERCERYAWPLPRNETARGGSAPWRPADR